jgi:hypothetical protein
VYVDGSVGEAEGAVVVGAPAVGVVGVLVLAGSGESVCREPRAMNTAASRSAAAIMPMMRTVRRRVGGLSANGGAIDIGAGNGALMTRVPDRPTGIGA